MKKAEFSLYGAERGAVRRRRVYYLSGFDPRGASFYHRLYRDEAGKQAALHGASIVVGPRSREQGRVSRWRVQADWDGHRVETDYQFLGWDDIVRAHWMPRRAFVLLEGVGVLKHYLVHGALGAIRRAGRGPFFSALFPYVGALSLGVASLGIGAVAAGVVAGLHYPLWAAMASGTVATAGGFLGGLRLAERSGVFWLLRTYSFAYRWGRRPVDSLEARMDEMAERILRDSRERPVDEVLLVGHSVGTMLAVSVAARLLRVAPAGLPTFKLLTLGGCIPLLSLLPTARTFRRDLEAVGASPVLPWTDIAAQADPLCFARTNPLTVSGLDAPRPGQPRQVLARFFRMFPPERYKKLSRNKLRLHFQYLMAGEIAADYDYFRLTAGPDPVAVY